MSSSPLQFQTPTSWSERFFMRLLLLLSACLLLGAGGYLASTKLGAASVEKSALPTGSVTDKSAPNQSAPADKAAVAEAKPLTLVQAIQLVEQSGKGDVVSADKLGVGKDISFNIETITPAGRTTLHIDGLGKAIAEVAKKGKKKGQKQGGGVEDDDD